MVHLTPRMLKKISLYNEGLSIHNNYTISNTLYSIFNSKNPSLYKYYSDETNFCKLINNARFDKDVSMMTLAHNGWLNMFKLCVKHNMQITFHMLLLASFYGQINIVKYIITTDVTMFDYDADKILYYAASRNHLNILKWIYNNVGFVFNCTMLMIKCAKNNKHIEIIKWLEEIRPKKDDGSCNCWNCDDGNFN
jgi:hypothetical protein